jgi:hypothetical protein
MNDERIPQAMRATYDAIVALTDRVCAEHLSEEYAQLSRKAAAMLARKRPSPLMSGKPATWAAGIVYALGQMNFLFDREQDVYLAPADLAAAFGVSQQTAGTKATKCAVSSRCGALTTTGCGPVRSLTTRWCGWWR